MGIFFDPKTVILSLEGEINEENAVVLKKKIQEAERQSPGILLAINSQGGSLQIALQGFRFLLRRQVPVDSLTTGVVGSSALLLFMAGERRIAPVGTKFVFHRTSVDLRMLGHSAFRADEFVAMAKVMRRQEKRYVQKICERSGGKLTQKKLRSLMDADAELGVEEALKLGIVTELVI